jgi:hypothetical protein
MRALTRALGTLFVLVIWTGCGDGQQSDISAVIGPYCEQMVTCQWYDDVEVCQQLSISGIAAFTHVYGQECGDVLRNALECETFLDCGDFSGCDDEWDVVYAVCS